MSCVAEGDKFFIYMPTGTLSRKKVCTKRGTFISQHIMYNTGSLHNFTGAAVMMMHTLYYLPFINSAKNGCFNHRVVSYPSYNLFCSVHVQ